METEGTPPEHGSDLHELLTENLRVANDNNHILRRMQYWGRVAFWAKVLLWTVVLVLPFFFYSYWSPLLNILPGGIGGNTSSSSTSLFGFPSPVEFEHLFHHTS